VLSRSSIRHVNGRRCGGDFSKWPKPEEIAKVILFLFRRSHVIRRGDPRVWKDLIGGAVAKFILTVQLCMLTLTGSSSFHCCRILAATPSRHFLCPRPARRRWPPEGFLSSLGPLRAAVHVCAAALGILPSSPLPRRHPHGQIAGAAY